LRPCGKSATVAEMEGDMTSMITRAFEVADDIEALNDFMEEIAQGNGRVINVIWRPQGSIYIVIAEYPAE
jgi:hypothetical protein